MKRSWKGACEGIQLGAKQCRVEGHHLGQMVTDRDKVLVQHSVNRGGVGNGHEFFSLFKKNAPICSGRWVAVDLSLISKFWF